MENKNPIGENDMKKKFTILSAVGILCGCITYTYSISKKKSQNNSVPLHKQGIYEKWVKRPLDLSCAVLATIILSPVILVTAVLVRFKLGSPVIFKQERPGLNGNIFTLYKFRTMTDKRDANGELLPDEERLTKFGKLLRSTSLDELPELWNIIQGDMSIVGPRPLLKEYLPVYSEREKKRHLVRGGLTGLAQVNGRNFLPWDERLEKDVQYVENISFLLDCKIVKQTVMSILKHDDVAVDTDKVEGNLAELRSKSVEEKHKREIQIV